MPCLEIKNSGGKTHKGERFPPTEDRMHYVPAKPVKNKKMAFCFPSITLSHITARLLPGFKLKRSSKQWEMLILSAEQSWEAVQAAQHKGNNSHTTGAGDADNNKGRAHIYGARFP